MASGGGGDAADAKDDVMHAEVVIVGGGIAGLATAVALRRAGAAVAARGVLVLECHAELRATGAALTIFPNGWFALRALGVAHKLTSRYGAYDTSRVTNLETGATQVFRFAGNKNKSQSEGGSQEGAAGGAGGGAAAGHHPLLVQARLHRHRARRRQLIGHRRRPRIGRWHGDPRRTPTSTGSSSTTPSLPRRTPPATRRGRCARWRTTSPGTCRRSTWTWCAAPTTATSRGRRCCTGTRCRCSSCAAPAAAVTVAGDAFHPMTPDMAQGWCSALEDAVVLARELARVGAATPAQGVAAYVARRRWRAAWLVAGACVSRWVQQGGTGVRGVCGWMVKVFRDWIFYRFVFPRLADTMWFDCGDLTPPATPPPPPTAGKSHHTE